MTKLEEALCNGVTFSIPRLVPSAVQEGELENAMYYAYVLLTPALDKLVIKLWEAPDYSSLYIQEHEVESTVFKLERIDSENADNLCCYNYGHSQDGQGQCYAANNIEKWVDGNIGKAYNGLMLYPALKCLIIELIKSINILNEQENG